MPPHNTTSKRHLKTPPQNTTSQQHLTTPPHNTTSQHHPKRHLTPPHNATSQRYLTTPPHNATSQCHLTTPPHNATSQCYLTTPPRNASSQCHLTAPPHNTTSKHHLTTPPHNATSQHHLTKPLWMKIVTAICPPAHLPPLPLRGALLGILSSHWLSTSPCHSSSFCSSDWPEHSQPLPTADMFLPACYFCIYLNQGVILKMEAVGFSAPSE